MKGQAERRWDCHLHIIQHGDRFPLAPGRSYDPPVATLEDALAMLDRYDLTHGVLVQPSVYGFDNRCMLDALSRAEGRLRGIAVPHPDSTIGVLEAMHRSGVRGIRCNRINPGGLHPDQVSQWLPFMREAGWHVEMHIPIDKTPDLGTIVERTGVPVVIDHMGRPTPGTASALTPASRQVVELVRDGRCLVKLSAPYRLSGMPAPWPDVTPLALALLDADPNGCLWGSDWPHTDTTGTITTGDAIAARDRWLPDDATRRIVLSGTPDRLLGAA